MTNSTKVTLPSDGQTYKPGELYPWYTGAIVARPESTEDEDEWGWVMGYMKGTDNFSLTFYDNWTRFSRTKDFQTEMMFPDMTPFAIHYGFSAQSMFSYLFPPDDAQMIFKRVGEKEFPGMMLLMLMMKTMHLRSMIMMSLII